MTLLRRPRLEIEGPLFRDAANAEARPKRRRFGVAAAFGDPRFFSLAGQVGNGSPGGPGSPHGPGSSPSGRRGSPGPAPSPSSRRRAHHSSTSVVLGGGRHHGSPGQGQVRVSSPHQHHHHQRPHLPRITVEVGRSRFAWGRAPAGRRALGANAVDASSALSRLASRYHQNAF